MSRSNQIVRELLRLVTPDEISELTKISSSKPKVPLTAIVEKELQNLREYILQKGDNNDVGNNQEGESEKNIDKSKASLETGNDRKHGLEFLNDDGISHMVEGGLSLKIQYEMMPNNNSCKVYAKVE